MTILLVAYALRISKSPLSIIKRVGQPEPMRLVQSCYSSFHCFWLLQHYCFKQELDFPKCSVSTVVDFLCMIADSSHLPKSQLKCVLAAMSYLFEAIDHVNITGQKHVHCSAQALIKSVPTTTRKRSKVMPTETFSQLFLPWPGNELLEVTYLCLKVLTLLSSDTAPTSYLFVPSIGAPCLIQTHYQCH